MACTQDCCNFQRGLEFGRQWKQLHSLLQKSILTTTTEHWFCKKIKMLLALHYKLFNYLNNVKNENDMLTCFLLLQKYKKMYKKLHRQQCRRLIMFRNCKK